jgi:hypothetical protein
MDKSISTKEERCSQQLIKGLESGKMKYETWLLSSKASVKEITSGFRKGVRHVGIKKEDDLDARYAKSLSLAMK